MTTTCRPNRRSLTQSFRESMTLREVPLRPYGGIACDGLPPPALSASPAARGLANVCFFRDFGDSGLRAEPVRPRGEIFGKISAATVKLGRIKRKEKSRRANTGGIPAAVEPNTSPNCRHGRQQVAETHWMLALNALSRLVVRAVAGRGFCGVASGDRLVGLRPLSASRCAYGSTHTRSPAARFAASCLARSASSLPASRHRWSTSGVGRYLAFSGSARISHFICSSH